MNATATATATDLPTYVKAKSNTGMIHLALEGAAEAACASGKAKPLVTPVDATKAITCTRCQKIAAKLDADRIAAASDTADIDALLAEVAGTNDLGAELVEAITAAAPAAAPKAKGKAKGKGTAKAAQAAPQAAPEAAAAPAQAAPRQRLNQEELVLGYLRAHRGTAATPHEISKAVTPEGVKALGLRDCCARLAAAGKIVQASEKPVSYALA